MYEYGYGRFDEIPEEVVIALAADGAGYHAEGDRKDIVAREVQALVMEALPSEAPGLTADGVHELLPAGTRPRRGDVMKALHAGADAKLWTRAGSGKRGDPYHFWRVDR
jgi:hypothetical protein